MAKKIAADGEGASRMMTVETRVLPTGEDGLAAEGIEAQLTQVLSAAEITISLDFHRGGGRGLAYGCDLTDEYVRINGDYRS